jgi:hypothetical protein
MGWGQFGWRGSQDRSPTVNHRLKKKSTKLCAGRKSVNTTGLAARIVSGPQRSLPSACQLLFMPGGVHGQAQPSGLPVFTS